MLFDVFQVENRDGSFVISIQKKIPANPILVRVADHAQYQMRTRDFSASAVRGTKENAVNVRF